MDHACLRPLYNKASLCIFTIGANGRLLAMNPAGLAQVGADSEETIRGRPYLSFISPGDRERVDRLMADAFAGHPSDPELAAAEPPPARPVACCFIPCTTASVRPCRP